MMALALIIPALTGCQKEEPVAPGPRSEAAPAGDLKYYAGRELSYSSLNQKWGCFYPPGNCLMPVEITREKAMAFDGIWAAVQTGDKATISTAFGTGSATLSGFMQEEDLAGVIDGTREATGLTNTPGSSPERFLKISRNGTLVAVYPWVNAKK